MTDQRTPPAGYRKLLEGTRCRCIRLWQDGVGGFYCCRSTGSPAMSDDGLLEQYWSQDRCDIEFGKEIERDRIVAWLHKAGYRQIAGAIDVKEHLT